MAYTAFSARNDYICKVVQAHYYVRPLIVIIISQADLNVVGKNVSSNVSDHEGPSSVNNI